MADVVWLAAAPRTKPQHGRAFPAHLCLNCPPMLGLGIFKCKFAWRSFSASLEHRLLIDKPLIKKLMHKHLAMSAFIDLYR
jgi:hypothetical protein